jgi:hypothetical protein
MVAGRFSRLASSALLAAFTASNLGGRTHAADASLSGALSFGPIVELKVPDDASIDAAWLVDLDAGKLHAPPQELLRAGDLAAFKKWLSDNGIDAMGEGHDGGLMGVDVIARRIEGPVASTFPDASESTAARMLDQMATLGDPGSPIAIDAARGVGPRATYLFRTREGAAGVLQITGWQEDDGTVGIRYRLLNQDVSTSQRTTSQDPPHQRKADDKLPGFGPIRSAKLHALSESPTKLSMLDFDRGQLFTHIAPETATLAGVDVYPKPHPVHHTLKGKDISVVRVPPATWRDAERASEGLDLLTPTHARDYADMPANVLTDSPATYLFKTHQGGLGMFRIVKVDDKSHAVEIEYRIYEKSSPPRP